MAAKDAGVEKRPAQSVAETRVGDINRDMETQVAADDLAEGIDEDTKNLIVHDTTTRERTTVSKRAHEPLDPALADEDQPAEDGNGPRAKEINPVEGSTTSSNTVSEAQIKAGAEVKSGESSSDDAASSSS